MNHRKSRRFSHRSQTRWLLTASAAIGLIGASVAWNRHLNAPPNFHLSFPPMPSGPNAYDDFTHAADLAGKLPNRSFGTHTGLSPEKDNAVFAQDAPAIQALRTGFGLPYRDKGLFAQSQTDQRKEEAYYNHLRILARTLAFETQERAKRGDTSGSLNYAIDGIQMGATLPNSSGLGGRAVGVSCETLARKALWPVVEHLDAEQATVALQRLQAIDARREPLADSFRNGEQCGLAQLYDLLYSSNVRDVYQNLYPREHGGIGGASSETDPAHADRVRSSPLRDWCAVATMNRQQCVDDYRAWMQARTVAASLPYSVSLAKTLPMLDPLNRLLEDLSDDSALEPYFNEAANRAGNRLLELTLALRVYRLRTGSYPSSLDALVSAGILRSLPSDPFAPKADTPLEYQTLGRDDYALRSVGPDGVDDGGCPIDLALAANPGKPTEYRCYLKASDRGDVVIGAQVRVGAFAE